MVKTAFMADLDAMQTKFLGLAEAFPQDKYTWRPMEGVRSVSEVLMLSAMEGYSFVPTSFGAKAAQVGSREEMTALRQAVGQGAGDRPPEEGLRPRQGGTDRR